MKATVTRAREIAERAARCASDGERDGLIAAECGDDLTLEVRVRRLLAEPEEDDEEEAGEPHGLPPGLTPTQAALLAPNAADRFKPEHPGDHIGHYKLLQKLGEGAFGAVWQADQSEPVVRRVALKLIKAGMDSHEILARFEQEWQALALMEHANIARVFDAGTTAAGRPYFVMELVRGLPMTQYCDEARLSIPDRLRLFITVCSAVQHAHQKGIIHRDLKPSNILVTLQDGVAVPKVIDFGVAKVLQPRLTAHTLYTQLEQMIGSPVYMSPEQAGLSALDIDTRSDIYSLGVLLYELLAGRTPFAPEELMKGGYDEIRRMIREDEPARPSTLIGTFPSAKREAVARVHCTRPRELITTLRGDLDWIVMKALEKDRARRYDSASALAHELERYMRHEPVIARPPTTFYRMRRFTKRHTAGVAAAIGIFGAVLIGAGVSAWQADRAEREAARANQLLAELRDTAPAFRAQARDLLGREDYDGALAKLGYAIRLQPQSIAYRLERASILQGQLRLEEALADWEAIVGLQPSHPGALANAAICRRLLAGPRDAGGGLPRAAVADLYDQMVAAKRPAAELMPLARLLGRENQLRLEYWRARIASLPNASGVPMEARLTASENGLLSLDLSGTRISDLSALEGMPLGQLDLGGCRDVHALDALRGLPLRALNLSETGVTSLGPLAEIRSLEDLTLNRTGVSDLTPLRGLPLVKLRLARTRVSDLSPLRGGKLEYLEVGQSEVRDLSPLEGMPLKVLEASYTAVDNYAPLAKLPLEELALQGVRVSRLDFLRGLPLRVLVLSGARDVSGFDILREAKTLEALVLPGNPLELPTEELEAIGRLRELPNVKRMTCTLAAGSTAESAEAVTVFWPEWDAMMRWWRPLTAAGMKMKTARLPDRTWSVSLQRQPLESLAMFAGTQVSVLDLSGCRGVTDLGPLRGVPLTTLSIVGTSVKDLSPLAGSQLRSLWMAQSAVADLSPLRGLPLQTLYMDKCAALTDVRPAAELPELREVLLPEGAEGVETLRKLPRLERISYTFNARAGRPVCAAADFWREFGELGWLKKLRAAGTAITVEQLADATWSLTVRDREFAEVSLLEGARISSLQLAGTRVADVSPLQALRLKRLRLDGTPCKDVAPLAKIATLESLVLPAGSEGVEALRALPALKRIAFEADASGEPRLEAAQFWSRQAESRGQ